MKNHITKNRKIAILGTKGVPNNYGGFEQFADFLSRKLVKRGYDVTVYNPHYYDVGTDYKGVNIIYCWCPEKTFGSGIGNIIFDFLCLLDSFKRNFDLIFELGYQSVALSYIFLPIKRLKIVTNMDGIEWQRSKWGKFQKIFIKKMEKIAVNKTDIIMSDNVGIENYIKKKYNKESVMIPYGANIHSKFDKKLLDHYNIKEKEYFLIIARMEPENNIEMMIEGFIKSESKNKLLIVGNKDTNYAKKLINKYSYKVKFIGGLYNVDHLNSLRHYSNAYLHGHTVGGTNPSLVEAMSAQCFVISHKNAFNLSVLGDDALYYSSVDELSNKIKNINHSNEIRSSYISNNLNKVKNNYDWDIITNQVEELIIKRH